MFLELPDGNRLAYDKHEGDRSKPGIVFLHGLKSDRHGSKAEFLEGLCIQHNITYVRFECMGHGESSGTFEGGSIGQWKDNAIAVLDELTQGEQVLVGSSMGGWLMLLAALARPERIKALIGIAAAPDFTEDLVWQAFTEEQKEKMAEAGKIIIPNCYGGNPYPIMWHLIEEGRQHLLLKEDIPLTCPVRLLQGMQDDDVPWQTAPKLANALQSDDVTVKLIKDADHRLSRDEDLAILEKAVLSLI